MTNCVRQHAQHYPVSAGIPGKASGVTTEMFYSGINVVRKGMQPRTLHMTTVKDANGVEKSFLTDVRPSVEAYIRVNGGWKNPNKCLEWNPRTYQFEASIVEDVLYNLIDFSLNTGYNAGSNKIWVVMKTVDSRFTTLPQQVIFQLTEGQSLRYRDGEDIPVDGKPYTISFRGLKQSPVHYINSPKKRKEDADSNLIPLF